jgi:hypothetical protein
VTLRLSASGQSVQEPLTRNAPLRLSDVGTLCAKFHIRNAISVTAVCFSTLCWGYRYA